VTTHAVLAVDLGASRIRAGLVAGDGRVVAREDRPTPRDDGPAAVIGAILEMLRSVVGAAPTDLAAEVDGIGIGAPGPLDPHAGRLVEPPNLGPAFRDLPLAAAVADELGLRVVLERDTNVAALAEGAFGAAVASAEYLYLTVSTGIGGAIVSRGELLGGADGVAGELGHVLVDLDGPACTCGARGHLEAISSGVAIARAAAEAIAAGGEAAGLAARSASAGRALDARDVALAEEDGDPTAARVMERARRAFAESCVALVNTFNPELIVVGGSIARHQGERWLAPARERVREAAFRIPGRRVEIVPAALGDDVGLVGALPLLALRRE
jgi:glucokinase